MKRATTVVLGLGLVGGFAFATPAIGGPAFNNKYDSTATTDECKDSTDETVGTVTYNGPLYMWPPNHKEQNISIVASDVNPETDDDQVGLAVEHTHDEMADGEEMNGSGNTPVDSSMAGGDVGEDSSTVTGWLRSERSGRGDGRTYTLTYEATFTDGAETAEGYGEVACMGTFEITVPHDMRGGAGWKHDTDGDGQGDKGKHGDG